MCRFSLIEMEDVIDKIVNFYTGKIELPFEQANLMRLEAVRTNLREEAQGRCTKVCINEVYISRKSHERITLEIKVNGEVLTKTSGDGMLISTPTGSTAYSLSAGGPILDSEVNGILIVPISPNSLSFRPICLPSTSTITIKVFPSPPSSTQPPAAKPMQVSTANPLKISVFPIKSKSNDPNTT
jgi:NAD kinase